MLKIAMLALIVAASFSVGPSISAPLGNAEPIPPNCTLDPFTHKQVCHIWPTCTLDPFTHKMNCPVPKAAVRAE
jgi:hypothetical protein